MRDGYGREIRYMRISITDRCNLRCRYCMPEGIKLSPMEEILTFEEIAAVCEAAAALGITRFKITGGEPLVRLGCPQLVGMLKGISGVEQVTLTTNGVLLGDYLDELLRNGLDAVNVSLDTLDAERFRQITGFDELGRVRESILSAVGRGVRVKINSVLQDGINAHEWETLAGLAKENPLDVRFIEMMPIGYGKKEKTIEGNKILSLLKEKYPGIQKDHRVHGNGPAEYYRIPGFAGGIGFIRAVHGQFCENCNRIRLTAKGELKPCLCYEDCVDVRSILRRPEVMTGEDRRKEAVSEDIRAAICRAVHSKPRKHCFDVREQITEGRQMVQIGG